jgi:hypothetical protein
MPPKEEIDDTMATLMIHQHPSSLADLDRYTPRQLFLDDDDGTNDESSSMLERPPQPSSPPRAPRSHLTSSSAATIYHDLMMADAVHCGSPHSISRELIAAEENIRLGLARMGKKTRRGGILKSSNCKAVTSKHRPDSTTNILQRQNADNEREATAAVTGKSGKPNTTSFVPPRYVVVGSRESRHIHFHEQVLVVEIDRVDQSHQNDVWWTLKEMERFRYEASRCKDRRSKFGIRRSTRCVNHIRRILLQQDAGEELDGTVDDEYLAMISTESSKKSRESAYRAGLQIEEEVEQQSIINSKMMNSLPDNMTSLCLVSPRMADYYIGSFLSMCGSF